MMDADIVTLGPPKRRPTEYAESRKREMKIFGKRLWDHMIRKGWNQAEFSRQTKLHDPKGKGIGRDMIGGYVRCLHLPDPPHLRILAATLGVEPEVLIPTLEGLDAPVAANTQALPPPPMEFRSLGNGNVMMHINLEMPLQTAVKLLSVLEEAGVGAP